MTLCVSRRGRLWLAAIVTLAIFYSPFLLGGSSHTYLRVVDNLDNSVPYNSVIGYFYSHPQKAQHLLLAGNVPVYSLLSFTWPLTLLNFIDNQFSAYFLNDLIVRITAATGMFLLARRLELNASSSLLIALIFSLSLTITALGFSVAAIPAILYLAQKDADGFSSPKYQAGLIVLGWNTALALTGLFVLIAFEPLRRILFGKAKRTVVRTFIGYTVGLALGNAGLAASVLVGVPSQRDAWVIVPFSAIRTMRMFIHNQIHPYEYYYDTTGPLLFLYFSVVVALFVTKHKTIGSLIAGIYLFDIFDCLLQYGPIAELRAHFGGLARTFNLGRFYLLDSTLVILAWIIAVRISSLRMRRLLTFCAILQMAAVLYATPHLYNSALELMGMRPKPAGPLFPPPSLRPYARTFAEYYKQEDYRQIKNLIGEAPTLSVGTDPMAAVMNGISAIDGYYVTYPLKYKIRFRPIIAAQLSALPVYRNEFDDWGNHVYTFSYADRPLLLNYCAASTAGAQYVISAFELAEPHLIQVGETDRYRLRLYSIRACH